MEIELKLSVDQTNLILTALQEMPFRVTAGLIQQITTTAQQQMTPAPEPAPTVEAAHEPLTA